MTKNEIENKMAVLSTMLGVIQVIDALGEKTEQEVTETKDGVTVKRTEIKIVRTDAETELVEKFDAYVSERDFVGYAEKRTKLAPKVITDVA